MSWTLFDVIVTGVDRAAGELTGLAVGDSVGGRAARHRCERGGSTVLWTYRIRVLSVGTQSRVEVGAGCSPPLGRVPAGTERRWCDVSARDACPALTRSPSSRRNRIAVAIGVTALTLAVASARRPQRRRTDWGRHRGSGRAHRNRPRRPRRRSGRCSPLTPTLERLGQGHRRPDAQGEFVVEELQGVADGSRRRPCSQAGRVGRRATSRSGSSTPSR